MASSRKRPSADPAAAVATFLEEHPLRGKRAAVALSGGVDSVTLLFLLKDLLPVRAIHVHHGLSPNADAWTAFCRKLCREWRVPLTVRRAKVRREGQGPEAAARKARYEALGKAPFDVVFLAHHLDDQAETVLMNLLRGAGLAGARGMPPLSRRGGKTFARPLLQVPREEILSYAKAQGLRWVEDESNADESLTRNFVRRRLGPLIESRFPRWKASLGRAARHFAKADIGAEHLLRRFLREKGLEAPSEAKLVEMLRQLTARGARTAIEHGGTRLRVYRSKVWLETPEDRPPFRPVRWRGERRLALPALGGEIRFRSVRGRGIDADQARGGDFVVRLRSGGERLQPDARRPRRTLKNLFQEAGVPPWRRERLPLLFDGDTLVWAPGLGVEARYRAPGGARGLLPEWRDT